ncbi:unnamed protein product [Mycena citricolor]|uniref:Uncharacterized protein n=1 Tax=Mycena citricolor TaxID=2018698 RepID=A0AAD2Q4K1_9AGAR|nr:unnamed protein product [Mycena citricolor]
MQSWCPKCDVEPNNLDGEGAWLCTQTKTEALIMCFNPGILWTDYGTRANVPFTNKFLQADIHEILSSDLLHQVFKGTFKDHVVTWIVEYLVIAHVVKPGQGIIGAISRSTYACSLHRTFESSIWAKRSTVFAPSDLCNASRMYCEGFE